jgi:antirestriction protein ArdC
VILQRIESAVCDQNLVGSRLSDDILRLFRANQIRCRGTGCQARGGFPVRRPGAALEPREVHAACIVTWLKVWAADNRAVFIAAAHAQRAAEFINSRATGAAAQVIATCAA